MNIAVYLVLTGLSCIFIGSILGFTLGTISRLFFQYSFLQFIRENVQNAEDEIKLQLDAVQSKAAGAVASAQAHVTELYKSAALDILKSNGKEIVVSSGKDFN